MMLYMGTSALDPDPDPDPDPWIQPFLAGSGSGSVFGSGSTDPGDIMFSLNSWQNLRAFRLLNFENPSQGAKVRDFLSWGQNLWVFFYRYDNVTLIFEDGIGQKFVSLDKKFPTLMAYNSWTNRLPNLKKVSWSEFQALSIEITWICVGSRSTKIAWIQIRIKVWIQHTVFQEYYLFTYES